MNAAPSPCAADVTATRSGDTWRAITLDVGSTLLDPHPSVGHIYAEVAAQHGHPQLSPHLLNERFHAAFHGRSEPLHASGDWAAVVDETFLGLVDPPPSRSFFTRLYQRFSDPASWHVHADVVPALTELRARRVPLVVVSNWDDRLRPLLRSLDLDRFFQHIVVSCEVGWPKPHPAIFQRAAQLLHLLPQSILHVGDQLQADVLGARNAGFQARLLDRDQRASRTTDRISSLTQLL
jgi:putative hydrolase of the HAD superfamily